MVHYVTVNNVFKEFAAYWS